VNSDPRTMLLCEDLRVFWLAHRGAQTHTARRSNLVLGWPQRAGWSREKAPPGAFERRTVGALLSRTILTAMSWRCADRRGPRSRVIVCLAADVKVIFKKSIISNGLRGQLGSYCFRVAALHALDAKSP
jgi:hypothetical protein